ncbi:MAG TPA: hypothetical protein PKE20_10395 [Promineifilum sp.]|nr:hypothetical protein [Promineifilum sp.]
MKLAEALILRSDPQKQPALLRERPARVARVQEGGRPAGDPANQGTNNRPLFDLMTL